mgnify:CR=1 FL=1
MGECFFTSNIITDTGFHLRFGLRREIGYKLLKKHKIASLSIMNPFYGSRKPEKQKKSSLLYVTIHSYDVDAYTDIRAGE